MEFRILGPFEVVGTDGVLAVRGAKRRGLLACLVVHAGVAISTDRLVEELWGDSDADGPGAARTVQTYVSQLRKLLHDQTASLVTTPGGYVLEVDPAHLDATRFELGVAAAGADPDPVHRLGVLDEALELWRGHPLREFAGASWADRAATRLEALHLQALQRRYDTLLDLDRAADAAAGLEPLVGAYPLDERLWAQLMLALYRCGRQADALGAYQRVRRHLVNELGIEPGLPLVELERQILAHDPRLAAPTVLPIDDSATQAPRAGSGWHPRTFLLTDIVASVSLWERDPPAMSEAVKRHDAIIRDAVTGSGGDLVRTKGEGDSTFSVFAHPSDALVAAAAIQDALVKEAWPATTPVQVRSGVHTGDAEGRDGDWYGPAVNRAARLRALASEGQTLVSGVTAGIVADRLPRAVGLAYLGRRVLRGIERPEEVWELVGAEDPRLAPVMSAEVDGLPGPLTSFIGRTDDLEQLGPLIREERLVTLTGPGGSGKTRLALEVARAAVRHGERVWLAQLAPLREGAAVTRVIAGAVGAETVEDLLTSSDALAGLLVLDNCEHLVDACGELVHHLLAAAPRLRVLATSREPLGLPGERLWPVDPLEMPDAALRDSQELTRCESVRLLVERARAVRPDLEVGPADLAPLVQICRALDGLPLAIELAAGRLRSVSLVHLAARLDDQLAVLRRQRSGIGDGDRHRSLRLALDWSYDLLTSEQQTLARRLSVFAGGFRLDAVETVCPQDVDVLDGIDELVAKSLVTFDTASARYRMLEPIRQYLRDKLEHSAETEPPLRTSETPHSWSVAPSATGRPRVALRRRRAHPRQEVETATEAHARWVAGLCDRLGTRLLDDQRAHSRRLREETDNIDTALRWALDRGDDDMALRMVGSLGWFWFINDQITGRRWCVDVLGASSGGAPRRRAKALLGAGMVTQNDREWDRSVAWLREALSLYRAAHAHAGDAVTGFWLGRALSSRGRDENRESDTSEAKQMFETSLRISERLGDSVLAAWCRLWLCIGTYEAGDADHAEQLCRRLVTDCGEAGMLHPLGQALGLLAELAVDRGDRTEAQAHLLQAATIYRELDDPWQLAGVLHQLASSAAEDPMALDWLAESVLLDAEIGPRAYRTVVRLATAAVVHLVRGADDLAITALGAWDAHSRQFDLLPTLSAAVGRTRAELDPEAVARARDLAMARPVDELVDELILRAAAVPR